MAGGGGVGAWTARSVESRALKNAAPAGDYLVLQFETTFEKKAGAVETMTAMREADGTWHVGGYFIK
jgi:hypothetical protein